MPRIIAVCLAAAAGADAFSPVAMPTVRTRGAVLRSAEPDMGLGYKLAVLGTTGAVVFGTRFVAQKITKARETSEADKGRAALAGMSTLSSLAGQKLELEGGKAGRIAGQWKEYVKADGKKWYYDTVTCTMTWNKPEVFKKMDEVSEAATAANIERTGF